ncbi:NASP-related protein sim3 [Erysiphe neolycopersici]|uniref:NASP-related protein sim3 n=1 Tax=Erysiphe neolycopersici TaxID=212602 RepID=A0A420HR93_9PEZI|nr:NASP-related protein sim3 [Erysiphe neolycopersici]
MTESICSPKPLSEEPSATSHVLDSIKDSLVDLCAKGGICYTQKNYEQAADLYSRATELQVELNGEMSPENAEILFLYGRSLFKLGQSKSDVLGEVSGNMKKKSKSETSSATSGKIGKEIGQEIDDTNNNILAQNTKAESENHQNTLDAKKQLFQFTGDENFEGSDEEEVQNEEDQEEEDDGDDLAAAFDVLDLARVLFEKKLKTLKASDDEGKESKDLSIVRRCKERLADTHDQLAEISLENESFPAAVADCRAALAYKKELYSEEESIIAEAHFKLSLALEFAAITTRDGDGDENKEKEKAHEMDQSLRNEAADEMEAAIKSTNLRLQEKELSLTKLDSPDKLENTRNQITEIKEMLSELQTRLEDLKTPVFDVKSVLYGPLVGKLGILNAPTSTDETVEQVKKIATDVTGLVRKKSKAIDEPIATSIGEKRKGESIEENDSKRTKFNEVDDIVTPI